MFIIHDKIDEYLECSRYINWQDESILKKARQLASVNNGEIELIKRTYHFVRDEIKHSWDAQDRRITISATDVLHEKVGICWAKSNLLAALLRANKIPAGICYQRLTFGKNPESGYCIHALNAVYLADFNKWIRLDARGNKDGVNAEMCLEHEQLAFPVRPELGEIDYNEIYAKPLQITINVLESSADALEMYLNSLPDRI